MYVYDIRSADVLETLAWKNFDIRPSYTKSVLMYKILNDHTAPNLKESFKKRSEYQYIYIYIYIYIYNDINITLPKPKREILKRSFKYNGAMLWNNLPYEAKSAESLYSFKRLINNNHSTEAGSHP